MKFRLIPLVLLVIECAQPPGAPAPLPPHSFAFAVFGDGPYRSWEVARFHRVIEDVNRTDLAWFLHVGDIFWYPCSDENYRETLAKLNTIQLPVVYTPGDNEWADCGDVIAGNFDPRDRLRVLRATFFPEPGRTLGARPMHVTSQAENPELSEFVENVRWVKGGFVFITVHMLLTPDPAETDAESLRRTGAAILWLDEAFAMARADSLHGVVVAMQGDPGLNYSRRVPGSFLPFIIRLEEQTRSFAGPVVLIHGDSHMQRFDQPLKDEQGVPVPNFWRIETFGSPEIGWVRVVLDSVAGKIVDVEPRKMPRW